MIHKPPYDPTETVKDPSLKVVPLRPGRALLSDIPGMMRQIADQIEKGEIKDVTEVMFIIPRPGKFPDLFGWGEPMDDYMGIAVLELAKIWLIQNRTERKA